MGFFPSNPKTLPSAHGESPLKSISSLALPDASDVGSAIWVHVR